MTDTRRLLFQVMLVILAALFAIGLYFYRESKITTAGSFGTESPENISIAEAFGTIEKAVSEVIK